MYTIVMTMQIEKQEKKGGPYTKTQQDQRRDQVYEMHFNLGYSAVKIAHDLQVNRNTVNDDINYWYSEVAQQFGYSNLAKGILRQFERLEIQRRRTQEEIQRHNELEKIYRLEKFLFEIDQKIAQLVLKMIMAKRLRYSLSK